MWNDYTADFSKFGMMPQFSFYWCRCHIINGLLSKFGMMPQLAHHLSQSQSSKFGRCLNPIDWWLIRRIFGYVKWLASDFSEFGMMPQWFVTDVTLATMDFFFFGWQLARHTQTTTSSLWRIWNDVSMIHWWCDFSDFWIFVIQQRRIMAPCFGKWASKSLGFAYVRRQRLLRDSFNAWIGVLEAQVRMGGWVGGN